MPPKPRARPTGMRCACASLRSLPGAGVLLQGLRMGAGECWGHLCKVHACPTAVLHTHNQHKIKSKNKNNRGGVKPSLIHEENEWYSLSSAQGPTNHGHHHFHSMEGLLLNLPATLNRCSSAALKGEHAFSIKQVQSTYICKCIRLIYSPLEMYCFQHTVSSRETILLIGKKLFYHATNVLLNFF